MIFHEDRVNPLFAPPSLILVCPLRLWCSTDHRPTDSGSGECVSPDGTSVSDRPGHRRRPRRVRVTGGVRLHNELFNRRLSLSHDPTPVVSVRCGPCLKTLTRGPLPSIPTSPWTCKVPLLTRGRLRCPLRSGHGKPRPASPRSVSTLDKGRCHRNFTVLCPVFSAVSQDNLSRLRRRSRCRFRPN